MAIINLAGEYLVQSPYTYMQAAGSDGADGTVKGFHLRWDFKNILQERHLPKGNLSGPSGIYPATHGFNKDNDFVSVYKTAFQQRYFTEVNFSNNPTTIIASGSKREWRYSGITPFMLTGGQLSKIIISFPNIATYDVLAGTINPATSALNFIKNYEGEINVCLENQLSFRVEWDLLALNPNGLGSAKFRYELISLSDTSNIESQTIKCRENVNVPTIGSPTVAVCEDIERVRFDRSNVYPIKMRLYGYTNYLEGVNQYNSWSKLGDFGLTTDQTTAYNRLEDPTLFSLNKKWPKFNESNLGTGAFTVNVANYKDRWSKTQGLSYGVQKYLTLSQVESNYKAIELTESDDIGGLSDESKSEINYFDFLSIVSIDYHAARMLGLGHIDAQPSVSPSDNFIYLMEYNTTADLEDGGGSRAVKHIYITPNVKSTDYKLPELAKIDELTYGLSIKNGTPDPTRLTDENGYTKFADIRFVNINRKDLNFDREMESFFETTDLFCLCGSSAPIAFGLEYGLSGNPYVKPEINHDSSYNDEAGIPETILIPKNSNKLVYRHQEKQEGIHCYALYSINWFSRASVPSVNVCTDLTKFPKRNTILPPANFAVQLVQPEEPVILTTSQEQLNYAEIVGDKTYVRASFDWNYIHHKAYQFADKAEIFFNKQEKLIVQGKIVSVTDLPDNKIQITTSSYDNVGVSPMETVQPVIIPGTEIQFLGSLFSSSGQNFRVEDISVSGIGENPTFIIHKIRETHSIEDPLGSNFWLTTETYISPNVGDRFLVGENLGKGSNWDNRLLKTIYLERFGNNDMVKITGSSLNDGMYHLNSASFAGGNTKLLVRESINDSIVDGNLTYEILYSAINFNVAETGYLINGNVTADFSGITNIKVFGTIVNDGSYTILSVNFDGTNTNVVLNEPLDSSSSFAKLSIQKQIAISGYDAGSSTIILTGNFTDKIRPTRKENRLNEDGTITQFMVGGLTANCTITELEDVYNPDNVEVGFSPGDAIAGSKTGVYEFTFSGNPLPSHIDSDVKWFRGKVRVLEDAMYLPTPLGKDTAMMRELDVWNVGEDISGNLVLTVKDSTFQVDEMYVPTMEYVPILKGIGIEINYHPSYLFYLTVDENTVDGTINEFNESSIIPTLGEGSRKTFLGVRAVDSEKNDPFLDDCASHVATPAVVIAEEIREPQPPNPPTGPLYATRPDFYGKATYTMDVSFPNIPYSVLVYRANERLILSALYNTETVEQIISDLNMIQPDPFFSLRWSDLVNANTVDNPGFPDDLLFKLHGESNYRFPIPNNTNYIIPKSTLSGVPIHPFNGIDKPGSDLVTFSIPGNPTLTMREVVKEAITGAFVSQTKTPMLFDHLKIGKQTSNLPPRLRDENDILIAPSSGNPLYNPSPFAVKLPSGNMRFTDYNIDGGSDGFYFYYAMELSAKQKKSEPSGVIGPIQLINTRPAKEPKIKQFTTQIKNPSLELDTAVCFKLEEYVASERINRIDIYRAIDFTDAISVRTMDLAAQINITDSIAETNLCDVFEGLDFPLYGEDLYYRLIAMREVVLEDGVTHEFIPSEPSKLIKTSIVDPDNPPAPCLISENGLTTTTKLEEVVLKWNSVAYNATYSLQKMNSAGNWNTIYTIKTNDSEIQYPPLDGGVPDFINFTETKELLRHDDNNDAIYYRFRVQVENSSGLFNLNDCPLTLATGCFDLATLNEAVGYEDNHGFVLSDLTNLQVDDGTNNHPGKIIIKANIPAILPAGHNSFDKLEISVKDDLGNIASAIILTPTGIHTFLDGDGDTVSDDLQLNGANHSYTITTVLYTDLCTTGFKRVSTLNYVNSPCNDLSNLTEIIQLTDSEHTINLTDAYTSIDEGVGTPVSLTFTDISNVLGLANPQTFTQIEITLSDGLGNSDTKVISTIAGSVTFNDGDNGLNLDNDSNRYYTIVAELTTTQCPTGQIYNYEINYTFSECGQLANVAAILSFADSNGGSLSPLIGSEVDNGVHNPGGSVTLTDLLSSNLPLGHTLTNIEVDLYDGNGGSASKNLTIGSSVTFNTGDGELGSELDLGGTNPNPIIRIYVRAETDLCLGGASYAYDLSYIYDPYEDLGAQTHVVNYLDANGLTKTPLDSSEFNDGTNAHPGGSMVITESISSNLPAGDTFTKVEISISDGLGHLFTKEITTIGGNTTFVHGDGGLVLNGSNPNRTYTYSIKVISVLCPEGVLFVYAGRYNFGV